MNRPTFFERTMPCHGLCNDGTSDNGEQCYTCGGSGRIALKPFHAMTSREIETYRHDWRYGFAEKWTATVSRAARQPAYRGEMVHSDLEAPSNPLLLLRIQEAQSQGMHLTRGPTQVFYENQNTEVSP